MSINRKSKKEKEYTLTDHAPLLSNPFRKTERKSMFR